MSAQYVAVFIHIPHLSTTTTNYNSLFREQQVSRRSTRHPSSARNRMRFTITREKLQEGLAAVAPAVPNKTTLPVLANLLVQTTDKGIRISGTDLDIAVSTEVTADVRSEERRVGSESAFSSIQEP